MRLDASARKWLPVILAAIAGIGLILLAAVNKQPLLGPITIAAVIIGAAWGTRDRGHRSS